MKRKKKDVFNQALPFVAGYVTKSLFTSPEKRKITEEEQSEILMQRLVKELAKNPTGEKEQAIIRDIQKRAKKAEDRRKADCYFWILFWIIIILIILFRE